MTVRILHQEVSADGRYLALTAEFRPDPEDLPDGIAGDAVSEGRSETRSIRLLTRLYDGLLPLPASLNEAAWDALEHAAALSEAVAKATQLLACGTAAPARLCEKLSQRDFPPSLCEEAVAHLIASGVLDPAADALREVELCLRKRWGRRKIEAHLHARGYVGPALRDARTLLDETDFPALCADLIRHSYRSRLAACRSVTDPTPHTSALASSPTDKLRAALTRQGYTPSDIRLALAEVMGE
jgi:SOS response regulatory protein OraA/RecX